LALDGSQRLLRTLAALAPPRGEEFLVNIDQEAGYVAKSLDASKKKTKFLASGGIRTLDLPACSLVIILTTVS